MSKSLCRFRCGRLLHIFCPKVCAKISKIGARLLVPFGKRQITGYAVALHAVLSQELEIEESALKEAIELLDAEPLLTEEIIKLTQWTADYYASSWGEVLKASLPAGINANVEQIVSITARGRDELIKITSAETAKVQILRYLSENSEISARELGKKFGVSKSQKAIRELVSQDLASVFHRTMTTQTKPKRRKAVRLLPPESHEQGNKPLTAAQQKIIDVLLEENGELIFTDLIEKADVGASSINTLAKRGILEIFVQEVRRDPLENAELPDLLNLTLTDEQTKVLSEIEKALQTEQIQSISASRRNWKRKN